MYSLHFSSPCRTTHSSRGFRVSGHAQQIFLPLIGDTCGPLDEAAAGAEEVAALGGEDMATKQKQTSLTNKNAESEWEG